MRLLGGGNGNNDSAEAQRELPKKKSQHLLSADVKCDAPGCTQHNPEPLGGNIQLTVSQSKENSLLVFVVYTRCMSTLKHTHKTSFRNAQISRSIVVTYSWNLKYADSDTLHSTALQYTQLFSSERMGKLSVVKGLGLVDAHIDLLC